MRIQTVLALTDQGKDSVAGLKAAYEIARRRQARLVVGHVLVPRTLEHPQIPEFLRAHGLDPSAATVDIEIDADVMSGIDLILDKSAPDLVVLSAPRRTGFSRLLFASMPVGLIGKMTCPVLALHSDDPRTSFRRALVCVDGAATSQLIVDATAALIEEGGEISTLFVVEDSPLVVAGMDIGRYDPATLAKAEAAAREFQKKLTCTRKDIKVRHLQRTGDAVPCILQAEQEVRADVVAVGTSGIGGTARFLLGSVASGVVRKAASPVLTVPTAQ